jgi:excisionase family DNA binding protein
MPHVLQYVRHCRSQLEVSNSSRKKGTASQSEVIDVPVFDLPLTKSNEATVRKEQGSRHFLTVEEVAARLGVSRNWVYTHANELGVCRLGKYLRFSSTRVLARLGQ